MLFPASPSTANAVRPEQATLDLARTIPAPALIFAHPQGLRPVETFGVVVTRIAALLQGRAWCLVAALASWPGCDTTPVINVWTTPASPVPGGPRIEWLCTAVLTEGARLDLLEPALRKAVGYAPTNLRGQPEPGKAAA